MSISLNRSGPLRALARAFHYLPPLFLPNGNNNKISSNHKPTPSILSRSDEPMDVAATSNQLQVASCREKGEDKSSSKRVVCIETLSPASAKRNLKHSSLGTHDLQLNNILDPETLSHLNSEGSESLPIP